MKLAQVGGTTAINAIGALFNNGSLIMYSGTQPANPDTGLSGNTVLCTFTFSASAFAGASISGGFAQALASFVAPSVVPSNNGTATFARLSRSDTTPVIDATIGTSGTDIIIANTTLSTTINVNITSLVLKIPVD